MAGPTITGYGSNLNIQEIVQKLVGADTAPKQSQINSQTLKATTSLSSIGKIQAALDAFRGALTTMTATSNTAFGGLSGSSSDEKIATVTTGNGAAAGSFALVVNKLATASKISTSVFAGGSQAVVNNGNAPTTLTIEQSGKKYDVSIPAGATLQQVRDSINSQYANQGLSANVLSDANGSRLVLTSSVTGKGTDIKLSGNSGLEAGTSVITEPQNAQYTLDGLAMESASNSVTDVVSGVTIKFVGTSPVPVKADGTPLPATPTTISVTASTTALKSSVKGFVDTYNALMTAINAETSVKTNPDGSITSGALTGDTTLRTLVSAVRNELNSMSGTGSMKALAQFGVVTDQKTGLLSIDDKKWSAAVLTNASDINGIFSGDNGLLARMTKATDSYALSKTGIFAARTASLADSLTDLKKQQETLDARTLSLTDSLTLKYNTMDNLVAKLKAQGDSIMTTLNSLNNPKSNN